MLPFLNEKFGNASSVHSFGQEARAAVDKARRQVASLIKARANEIVFTSGGTESNNLAIRGLCEAHQSQGNTLLFQRSSILQCVASLIDLEKQGWEITRLPVYDDGLVRVADVAGAIRPDTILISVMMANNEIGTIQPVTEIGEIVREEKSTGVGFGFIPTPFRAPADSRLMSETLGCDLLTLSAHKIYGPRERARSYIRRGTKIFPQQVGGHQERERRAGTESVANIVGFGVAAELARAEMDERNEHARRLRDRFEREAGGPD